MKLYDIAAGGRATEVAPRRGAWIETSSVRYFAVPFAVAPRRGAWIETGTATVTSLMVMSVAPRRGARIETWNPLPKGLPIQSRTPQGCVD